MRFPRTRDLHALWIGALLLGLALWFDAIWIGLLGVMLIGSVVLFIDWLVRLFKPRGRCGQD